MPSLPALAVTLTLSRGTTPTTENAAPSGFQHRVQPQAWLCATLASIFTSTLSLAQRHCRVPPVKPGAPLLTPLSTDGCIETFIVPLLRCGWERRAHAARGANQ